MAGKIIALTTVERGEWLVDFGGGVTTPVIAWASSTAMGNDDITEPVIIDVTGRPIIPTIYDGVIPDRPTAKSRIDVFAAEIIGGLVANQDVLSRIDFLQTREGVEKHGLLASIAYEYAVAMEVEAVANE